MVARVKKNEVYGDRFVDWLFRLTGDVRTQTGLSEKQSAAVIAVVVERVQTEYGGQKPYVHSQLKSSSILRRWRDGWTVQKIAADVGCSQDWVRRVVSSIQTPKVG